MAFAFHLQAAEVGDMARQFAAVLEEPVHPLFEPWQTVDEVFADDLRRDERQQADKRANFKPVRLAIDVELVVVKAILLIPQPRATKRVHRVDDGDEMLKEL